MSVAGLFVGGNVVGGGSGGCVRVGIVGVFVDAGYAGCTDVVAGRTETLKANW